MWVALGGKRRTGEQSLVTKNELLRSGVLGMDPAVGCGTKPGQFPRSQGYSLMSSFIHSFIHILHRPLQQRCLLQLGSIQSIYNNLLLQLLIVLVKALKQVHGVLHIVRSTRLADAVHAELRVAQVKGTSSQCRGQHGTDGATARRVVANHEKLQRNSFLGRRHAVRSRLRPTRCLLEQDNTWRVGGIANIGIDLDDGSLVHLGPVLGLILGGIVGVYGVSHVGGDEEGCG